jgi:hypothetical protein
MEVVCFISQVVLAAESTKRATLKFDDLISHV